ncbi:MAG: phage shock protein A [Bacteroidetes bacterium 4484_276]|nr:MAG: phage shock protein A [Bacteroidetes bacterium 4484_276]
MGIFSRLFKVGQSEAHAVVDKLENPIRLTEQGIRDLKKDLEKSMQAMAEVKAVAIRTKRELAEHENRALSYENKAIQLLKGVESGKISPADADRLASEALSRKQEALNGAETARANYQQLQGQIGQLNGNVDKLKSNITKYENELKMLKARYRVSNATQKLNKSLANVDSNGTISMLEKMKDKVAQQESLAQAYGEMADTGKSLDDEIDQALLDSPSVQSTGELAALKERLMLKG